MASLLSHCPTFTASYDLDLCSPHTLRFAPFSSSIHQLDTWTLTLAFPRSRLPCLFHRTSPWNSSLFLWLVPPCVWCLSLLLPLRHLFPCSMWLWPTRQPGWHVVGAWEGRYSSASGLLSNFGLSLSSFIENVRE